jgi:hypothetical protein
MNRRLPESLIIVAPPTGLTVWFAAMASRQLQPEQTAIAVVAYLGVLSVSFHTWLRLQEQRSRRGDMQQDGLQEKNHEVELDVDSLLVQQRQQSPRTGEVDPHSGALGGDLAPVLMLHRKDNTEGPEPSDRTG